MSEAAPGTRRWVAETAGCSVKQVHRWTAMGWLETRAADAAGGPRWWPAREAQVARYMVRLIDNGRGMAPAGAAKIARRVVERQEAMDRDGEMVSRDADLWIEIRCTDGLRLEIRA